MLLNNRLNQIASDINSYEVQIAEMQEKIRELQAHSQLVGSTESAMESAVSQLLNAISLINQVCPDELKEFKRVVSDCFSMPVAALEAVVEPVESEPVQSDVIESEPVVEPVVEPVAAPTKPTEREWEPGDKEPTVKDIKERFRSQFHYAKTDKELSTSFVKSVLQNRAGTLMQAVSLEQSGKAFWMAALALMDKLAANDSAPTEKAA